MGLLPVSAGLELVLVFYSWPAGDRLAFWLLSAGLIAAGPAILTGLAELLFLPDSKNVDIPVLVHLSCMVLAVCCFGAGWLAEYNPDLAGNATLQPWSSLIGLVLLMVGGWWGAELVYRYRVGLKSQTGVRARHEF